MALGTWIRLLKTRFVSVLRSALIGRYAVGVLCDTDQGLFVVDPADAVVGLRLARQGSYETRLLQALSRLIPEGGRLAVLGSHVGALLVPLAKRCDEVVAFEANPRTFRLLGMNIELNDVSGSTIHNLAVGEKEGVIQFLANTANSGGAKRRPLHSNFIYTFDDPDVIEVPVVRFDDVVPDHKFDLIVMDIEGSEYFALQGMQDTLSRSKHLLVEYLPHHLDGVSDIDDAQFASLIEPHFDCFKLFDRCDPDCEASTNKGELLALLRKIRRAGSGGDLLCSNF